jgi:hypothetical protein
MAAIRLGPDRELPRLVFAKFCIREESLEKLSGSKERQALQEEARSTDKHHRTRAQLRWVNQCPICVSAKRNELNEETTQVKNLHVGVVIMTEYFRASRY